jgi:predicted metal-dependent peptidase
MSRFASEIARDDFSYRRINRRMAAHGYILPGLYSERMGLMISGFDTSGSIGQKTFNVFGSHLTEIRNQMRPELLINILCDMRINRVDSYDDDAEMNFETCGGGGTDFRPVFNYIEEHGLRPACFFYLTDGEGRYPEHPPEYPVLWLMTTNYEPPWGEIVRINE